ncbi:RHS repeat-associated core domain-containing protein [Caballeronia concitans]|uniref:FG-GAP/YD repeat-containing protein n=1 Tax=Caballeronia concitans TaxID=1777133 RepID=A0A658R653_9BURK|nr:RHS repeat-associated core domain-containing protein [Caballeronia concitans]SAL52446.1 FG-GAP/YD repeat-containing protein [Caballeronia concitans]
MADSSTIVPTDNVSGITPGLIEGGAFSVSHDGAANYTLPLWVPAGKLGIQPELALRYSSRGGNGPLGVGWILTGIPQIRRSRKTFPDDGVEEPIQFDQSDPFTFDGERLVLVGGVHGVDGAEYRTKRDTFTKIILHDVDSAPDGTILGPTWFEVFQKDGRIFVFGGVGGEDLGSRFEGTAQHLTPQILIPTSQTTPQDVWNSVYLTDVPVRFAWSLSSVRDRAGNTLLIGYDGYPSNPGGPLPARDYVPTKMVYTGNQADGKPALRSVEFVWEDRPDAQSTVMSGLRIPQNKRLKELRMSGPDPTSTDPQNISLLRRYTLSYQTNSVSGRSLLASIQEFDGSGIGKPPHSFEYERGQSTFREIPTGLQDAPGQGPVWGIKTTPQGRSPLPGRIRVADFNGDGRDDILYVPRSDPNHFYILLSDPSSPTGFSAPFPTGIPVPAGTFDPLNNPESERVFVFPDAAGDWMNIFVLDDSVIGIPTYRVYHCGTDHSGVAGAPGNFLVFEGNSVPPLFTPGQPIAGSIEVVDLDGDGLPDLFHADTGKNPAFPQWYARANLGGNLNFGPEVLSLADCPQTQLYANLDGGNRASVLFDDSLTTGGDPRFSAAQFQRQGTNFQVKSSLTTLLRDQSYIFGDFTGIGLPSAFSVGNPAFSDPTLAENSGGGFSTPIPFVEPLVQQPPGFQPALRVIDSYQDGTAQLLVRTRTVVQTNDAMFVLRWNGSSFTPALLPFTSTWNLNYPEQFDVFEVFDWDGNGLDDVVMFSNGQLRVFVRDGHKADMLTAVVDGRGARIGVTYAPISDPSVHTAGFGYVYPQRAVSGKVWVVSSHLDDDSLGGVNTYQLRYEGGIEDVTGIGFLGFHARTVQHAETGITTRTTYYPEFIGWNGMYPMLGLPMTEETHVPLGNGVEHRTTCQTTYSMRPIVAQVPYFVFPNTIVEENVELANGVPTMPVRRRTISQDMDAYGNVTTYSETWSDGNKHTATSTYSNDPNTWLIGLLTMLVEQSTTPNGMTQTRKRAYEYDAQGLRSREIIEPGPPGPNGYLPLGPQPDGIKTLYRSIDRYPNGNIYRIVEEETTASMGAKRSRTIIYDDLEEQFAVEVDNALGHRLRATFHPGFGVVASLEDPNGVRRVRQYDGFGRFRHETSPDGADVTANYIDLSGGLLQVTVATAGGSQVLSVFDVLGRLVKETVYARDDGLPTVREIQYDGLGRVAKASRSHFATDPPDFDTFSYDGLSRPTGWLGPDGSTTSNEYRGEWVISTDGNKNATAVRIDNLDRVIFCTDRDAAFVGQVPGPSGTTYEHGPFDTVVAVTDIANNVTKATSDRLGRIVDLVDPDRGHRAFSFNAFGDLAQETKAGSQVTSYQYDPVGRLYWIQDVVDGDVKYTWDTAADGIGKVAQIDAPASGVTTAYAYDTAGRLTQKTWTIGSDKYSIVRGFDPFGRISSITYPKVGTKKPFVLGYRYGNFGQLLTAADTANGGQRFWTFGGMDATGLFGQALLGNGLRDVRNEDPGRPQALKSIVTVNAKGKVLRNLTYKFDPNFNVQGRDDKVLGTKEKFEYDAFNRLIRWTWKGVPGTRRIRWDYDDIGNILKRAVELGPGRDLTYTYNPSVAGPHAVVSTTLGSYQYDLRGNQVAGPGRTVRYGRIDLPTRITHTSGAHKGAIDFTYDGETNRVRSVDSTTHITSDTVDGLYEFRRPNGKSRTSGKHIFTIPVLGRPIAQRIWTIARKALTADEVRYLHADHQGSIDLVTDAKGKPVERLKYDPFGRRVSPKDPSKRPGPLKADLHTGFTGHEHVDDGWNLIDMKGRFYDPVLGRFLTPDPFTPRPLNPQSWNRYAYVLNNPLTLRDPSGFNGSDDDSGSTKDNDTDSASGHASPSDTRSGAPSPQYSDTKGNPSYSSTKHEGEIPKNGETVYAPGITTMQQCLADAKCADAHVITRTENPPPPPPPPPQRNDDGYGGAGLSGPPPNPRMAPEHTSNTGPHASDLMTRVGRAAKADVQWAMAALPGYGGRSVASIYAEMAAKWPFAISPFPYGVYAIVGTEGEFKHAKGEAACIAGYDPAIGFHVSLLAGGGLGREKSVSALREWTLISSSGLKPSETLLLGEKSTNVGGVGGWKAIGQSSVGGYAFFPVFELDHWIEVFVGAGVSISQSLDNHEKLERQ